MSIFTQLLIYNNKLWLLFSRAHVTRFWYLWQAYTFHKLQLYSITNLSWDCPSSNQQIYIHHSDISWIVSCTLQWLSYTIKFKCIIRLITHKITYSGNICRCNNDVFVAVDVKIVYYIFVYLAVKTQKYKLIIYIPYKYINILNTQDLL